MSYINVWPSCCCLSSGLYPWCRIALTDIRTVCGSENLIKPAAGCGREIIGKLLTSGKAEGSPGLLLDQIAGLPKADYDQFLNSELPKIEQGLYGGSILAELTSAAVKANWVHNLGQSGMKLPSLAQGKLLDALNEVNGASAELFRAGQVLFLVGGLTDAKAFSGKADLSRLKDLLPQYIENGRRLLKECPPVNGGNPLASLFTSPPQNKDYDNFCSLANCLVNEGALAAGNYLAEAGGDMMKASSSLLKTVQNMVSPYKGDQFSSADYLWITAKGIEEIGAYQGLIQTSNPFSFSVLIDKEIPIADKPRLTIYKNISFGGMLKDYTPGAKTLYCYPLDCLYCRNCFCCCKPPLCKPVRTDDAILFDDNNATGQNEFALKADNKIFLKFKNPPGTSDAYIESPGTLHLPASATIVDADWSINGNDVYHQPGNVGIGNNAPTAPLDVTGQIKASSVSVSGNITAGTFTGSGAGLTNIPADGDWTISGSDIYRSSGNVGIGNSSPAAPLDVTGQLKAGSLTVSGAAGMDSAAVTNGLSSKTLTVSSSSTLDSLTVNNGAALNQLAVSGASTLDSASVTNGLSAKTLTVSNASTLNSASVSNGLTANQLTVSGASGLNSATISNGLTANQLTVSGASSLDSAAVTNGLSSKTLTVSNASTLNSLSVSNGASLNQLTVSGSSTLDSASVTNGLSSKTLTVSNASTLNSASVSNGLTANQLTVSGASGLNSATISNGLTANQLTVSGASTLDNASITNSLSAKTLTVSNASTLDSLTVNNGAVLNQLTVSGASTLDSTSVTNGLNAQSLSVSGTSTLNSAGVTNGLTAGQLTVSGASGLNSASVSNGLTANQLTVSGASGLNSVTVSNGLTANQLSVSGTAGLNSLTVTNDVSANAFHGDGSGLTNLAWTASGGDVYKASGRTGIGTTLPNAALHVKGTAKTTLTGTISVNKNSVSVTGVGTLFTTELAVNDWILIDNCAYKVAVITSNTALQLNQVFASVSITSYPFYKLTKIHTIEDSSGNPIITISDNSVIITGNLIVYGKAGIGTTINTTYDLTVNQDLRVNRNVNSGGSCNLVSDAVLKTAIRPLSGSLSKLMGLKGVSFEWSEKSLLHNDPETGRQIGLLAQEVEREFPELVHTGDDGVKTVNYQGIVAPLIEAIKELKAENDKLQKRLEFIEGNLK